MTDPKYIADRDKAADYYQCKSGNWDTGDVEIECFTAGADWGYSRANSELEEKLRVAEEALVFYGNDRTWSPDNFLCGSEVMRSDLSETKWSRFTPGMRARLALEKLRGEK
jgi:hypothetical protein